MIATWMMFATIVATLLAISAAMLGRMLSLYRRAPVRWVWGAATVASIGFAAAALAPRRPPAAASQAEVITTDHVSAEAPVALAATAAQAVAPTRSVRASPLSLDFLPSVPPAIERAMLALWVSLSVVLLAILIAAASRLSAERRGWPGAVIDGRDVLVSPRFGPAIVGVLRPAIVIPRWVLSLDESSRRVIVAHEDEHRNARDPMLLLLGLASLVLMPWNVGLWFIWRCLRMAIEIDCDARVMSRGVDAGEYARVLLGAWNRAHRSWLPSPTFVERASGLGVRVGRLMRRPVRMRLAQTILGGTLAASVAVLACSVPAPRPNTAAKPAMRLIVVDGAKIGQLPPPYTDTVTERRYPPTGDVAKIQELDAPTATTMFGAEGRNGAELYYTKGYLEKGGTVVSVTKAMVVEKREETVPGRLRAAELAEMERNEFEGAFGSLPMTADRRAKAESIFSRAFYESMNLRGPALGTWPKELALAAKRDTALRTLFTSAAGRAQFDERSRLARPRGTVTLESQDKVYFKYYFHDMTLSADVISKAHAIIIETLVNELALYQSAPEARDARIALNDKGDAGLRALLISDSDRSTFDQRASQRRREIFPAQ